MGYFQAMSKNSKFVGFVKAETMAGLKAKINLLRMKQGYKVLGMYWETRKYQPTTHHNP